MNGDPSKLISTLRAQGVSDSGIINMIVWSPEFGLDKAGATKALASVTDAAGEQPDPVETRQPVEIMSSDYDPFAVPEGFETEEPEVKGETDTFLDGLEEVTKGIPVLGEFTDWMGDMTRSFDAGFTEGKSGTESISSVYGYGTDEDFEYISRAITETENVGLSDEAKELEEKLRGVDSSWERLAIRYEYKAASLELITRSLGTMVAMVSEDAGLVSGLAFGTAGAAAGALAGGTAGATLGTIAPGLGNIIGLGGGALSGGVTGFLKGFTGGITASVEAQAVIMEGLKEELFNRGLENTPENIELIFSDEGFRDRTQSRAEARGLTVGAIDTIVGAGAGRATKVLARQGARKITRTGVKVVIESGGASGGELAAQLIADGEVNMEEVVLEGLMEIPMGLTPSLSPSYKINGRRSSAADVARLIESGEYLGNADIEVKRDRELRGVLRETKKNQAEATARVTEEVQAEANRRGVQLHGVGLGRAVSHAYKRVTDAEANNDKTSSAAAVSAAVDHVTTSLSQAGVFPIDINEQSSGERATAMSRSRYDSKAVEANELDSRAKRLREEANSGSAETKKAKIAVAESLEVKAEEIRAERKEFYRRAALKSSDTAKAIQQLDIDNHNIERALADKNISQEAKSELIESLKENVTKRLELEKSLEGLSPDLTVKEEVVSHGESARKMVEGMDSNIKALESELESIEDEMQTQLADPDALQDVQQRLEAARQERSDLGALIESAEKAKKEYDSATEELGGEAANFAAVEAAEKSIKDSSEALSAALGITEDQQVSRDPSYSSESQLKAHSENGGSTFSLSSGDLIGQKKSSVSIFPDRSKIVEGREITKEDIDLYVQENKDLFEGNEDVLAVGTWFDEQSNQTYLDVSAVVEKEVAIDLGKQYNQKAVFDLELLEEVETGGTGEVVGDLKPLQERVKDIKKALEVSPKETKETRTSSDTEAIDTAVEESRSDVETEASSTDTSGNIPESAQETPRASDGKPSWREGMSGIAVSEARVLNNLQKILDLMGVKMYVYPDTDSATEFKSGSWGGLFDPETNTVHINPAQIRENAQVEGEFMTRRKTFSETVMEEVIHAVLPMAKLFEANPGKAKSIRKEIQRAISRDKALADRIAAKAETYRSQGKSEAVVFEEEVVEFLSALAADPSSVNLKIVDRVRIAINKMLVAAYGAVGKEIAIKDTDSMISIAAKFSAASEGRAKLSNRNTSASGTMESSMVSPASLRPDENGNLKVQIAVPTYRRVRGLKKEIGSHLVTKTFSDQWHFINWWKKATDMGKSDYYMDFKTADGKRIDVDRIKGYNSARESSGLSAPLTMSENSKKKAAAAVSQGIIGKAVMSTVRRRLGTIENKIKALEKRGQTNTEDYKGKVARLNTLINHIDVVIERESKKQGKTFRYGNDSSMMASDAISADAIENGMSPLDFNAISEHLNTLTGRKPKRRVVAYQAMFDHLMVRFPDKAQRKKHFFGLTGKYIADEQLRKDAFGETNPLNFFSDWHSESVSEVSRMIEDGTLTGTLEDNIAKLNVLAAITSPKSSASPNVESALWILRESEKYKTDNRLGITEALIKRATSKDGAPGIDGITKRGVRVGLRKLMALVDGDLSAFSNVPVITKDALNRFTGSQNNLNGSLDVNWNKLVEFLMSPYEGSKVKVEGMVSAQKVFGPKVGAWMVNLNSANYNDRPNSAGQKMSDIVTVDTHVLNTGALVLGTWYDAGAKAAAGMIRLRSIKDQITDYKTDGLTKREVDTLNEAQFYMQLGGNTSEKGLAAIRQASLIIKKELDWAESTIENMRLEGDEATAKMIERAVEKMINPHVSESNTLKREVSNLVSELTGHLNKTFGESLTPAQVGQLIFADRQVFAYSPFSVKKDVISRPDRYSTYASALRSISPSGVMASENNEMMASNMLLFPSEQRQEAAESPLFRNRTSAEATKLRGGGKITNKVVKDALDSDATSVRIMAKEAKISEGQKVGVRLNLNVMKNTGIPVQTMHDKTASGEALRYAPAVMVSNPELYVNQNARRKIVTFQENKFPMASVNGGFISDQLQRGQGFL